MLNSKGERMLAYVVSIDEIKPIQGYDRVEYARVNGWWVIVSKNDNLKVGDKCVYFEVDSKVNSNDERFAFLEKKNYKIKTQKMCKVISQGLLMPLSLFPEIKNAAINTDVTKILGVKYATEEDNIRKDLTKSKSQFNKKVLRDSSMYEKTWVKWMMKRKWSNNLLFFLFGHKNPDYFRFPKHFPFIHKTDEERCENLTNVVLGYERPLIVTEKLDGTSSTYILEKINKKKFEFYVLSRNIRQTSQDNIYWEMATKYNIEEELKTYLKKNPELSYVCIQGESVGHVQGNPLGLKENDFYAFNFIRSDVGRLSSIEGRKITNEMGIKWVPVLDTNYIMPTDMDEFKRLATAQSAINPEMLREGIVLRDPVNGFSFKNVSTEYLLKHNG